MKLIGIKIKSKFLRIRNKKIKGRKKFFKSNYWTKWNRYKYL